MPFHIKQTPWYCNVQHQLAVMSYPLYNHIMSSFKKTNGLFPILPEKIVLPPNFAIVALTFAGASPACFSKLFPSTKFTTTSVQKNQ